MSFLYRFNKPEYIFRPSQLLKRLLTKPSMENEIVAQLPWGAQMVINPKEVIGKSIDRLGFYELATSELLLRLIKSCDEFIDIGANIGYFTLVALSEKEFKGMIHSFEPHPKVYLRLKHNIDLQNESPRVVPHNLALSSSAGEMTLFIPEDFGDNEGIASLEKPQGPHQQIDVMVKRLDEVLSADRKYVIKIDTEGHEESVLNGAEKLFEKKSIGAILFEEFSDPKIAKSFSILKGNGFEIYRISRSLFGPKLVAPELPVKTRQWEPVNYLALHPEFMKLEEISKSGWSIL